MRISGGERALAALGYLPLLFLVPLKAKRDSMFVQFHARQGMVMFLLWLATAIVSFILLMVFQSNNLVQTIILAILFVATGLYAVMALFTILFKVLPGERYRMPLVADVALMLGL